MKKTKIINRDLFTKIVSVVVAISFVSFNATAATTKVPEPFRGHTENSNFVINYDDYSAILNVSVLAVGKSWRDKAPKSHAVIGTRMKSKRRIHTALEGNRFHFKNFKDADNKAILTSIRKSLEAIPDEVPMKLLDLNEQLAYWLNLYNITLIEQLVSIYPSSNLASVLYGDDSILDKKYLKVAGVELSLNDIHYNIILEKFGYDPDVMYGLYQGVIGGPNIRTKAFTGKTVFSQLEANADEFINSNRGTFKAKNGVMRVSSFYARNRQLFANFQTDLKQHLSYFIDAPYTPLLAQSSSLRANIKNMNISDLTGGYIARGGSVNTNSAALLNAAVAPALAGVSGFGTANPSAMSSAFQDLSTPLGRFPPDVVKMLQKMNTQREVKEGFVVIKNENENKKENEQ